MESIQIQPDPELLCINAERVYDWVILQANINNNVSVADLGPLPVDPYDAAVSNLTTDCYLVDAFGNPLLPNAVVDIKEVGERQSRTFVIDGAQVALQKISFIKTVNVVIEFSGLNGTTPFVQQSLPIAIEIPESLFLCAPEGTDLIVRLSDIEYNIRVNGTAGALTSVDIALGLCQSVQAVTNVTLELTADFCQPRDILIEQCPAPLIPAQCPVLFPG